MTTIVLLLLILVSLWMGFYQLFKQQGRILLRLDHLELHRPVAHAVLEKQDEPDEAEGPPPQSHFPTFTYPDLAGRAVSLDDFRGRRVLLLNWSFECGFCDSIATPLANLEASFDKQNVQLLLLADGDVRVNQEGAAEHGLKCPILLQKEEEEGGPFEHEGTPVAYLLDEEGRVAAPAARGADRVLALAVELAGQKREASAAGTGAPQRSGLSGGPAPAEIPRPHRLSLPRFLFKHEIGLGDLIKRLTSALGIKTCVGCERRAAALNRWLVLSGISGRGLKAGAPAPAFHLPDLGGRMISFEEFRGRRVLLVFTDPQCGPCEELAPHLVRLHREHLDDGLRVMVVGRGNPDENQRKAKQYGFEFPVLLQDRKWKVSKDYGILATPAAFLVGEDGVIARDAAVGRDAVLELIRGSQSSQKEE
jgi:peroxiredoxin